MRNSRLITRQFETTPAGTAVRSTHSRTNIQRPPSRRNARMISVDIDGTVADISKRFEYALQFGPDGSVQFYGALLDGAHYHMDTPIEAARDYLVKYKEEIKGDIVYLSGRREGTESESRAWLEKHGFPRGQIIHRRMGNRSLDFKLYWLRRFKASKWIDGHYGDRMQDDAAAARYAGIRFVHIVDHVWPEFNSSSFSRPTRDNNPS
jgi:acid phosphatase class B